MLFLPWQQTVKGNGTVVAYDPTQRDYPVVATIDGFIEEFYVHENQFVTKGTKLFRMGDLDKGYLDRLKTIEGSSKQQYEDSQMQIVNFKDKKENLNPDFVLNDSKYDNSKILVTGDNFGCGSSREHAVWALQDYGFSVVIAPSFADIFFSNCFKNGILPVSLDQKIVEKLQQETDSIEVDLEKQTIKTSSEDIYFEIDRHKKKILLEGLDDISQTFQYEDKISEFEKESKVPSVL